MLSSRAGASGDLVLPLQHAEPRAMTSAQARLPGSQRQILVMAMQAVHPQRRISRKSGTEVGGALLSVGECPRMGQGTARGGDLERQSMSVVGNGTWCVVRECDSVAKVLGAGTASRADATCTGASCAQSVRVDGAVCAGEGGDNRDDDSGMYSVNPGRCSRRFLAIRRRVEMRSERANGEGGRRRERDKAAVTNLRNAFRRFVTAGSCRGRARG